MNSKLQRERSSGRSRGRERRGRPRAPSEATAVSLGWDRNLHLLSRGVAAQNVEFKTSRATNVLLFKEAMRCRRAFGSQIGNSRGAPQPALPRIMRSPGEVSQARAPRAR